MRKRFSARASEIHAFFFKNDPRSLNLHVRARSMEEAPISPSHPSPRFLGVQVVTFWLKGGAA